jgi:hypothetical protein
MRKATDWSPSTRFVGSHRCEGGLDPRRLPVQGQCAAKGGRPEVLIQKQRHGRTVPPTLRPVKKAKLRLGPSCAARQGVAGSSFVAKIANRGWSLYGAPWLQPMGTVANAQLQEAAKTSKTVAVACDQLPTGPHGKERVDQKRVRLRPPATKTSPRRDFGQFRRQPREQKCPLSGPLLVRLARSNRRPPGCDEALRVYLTKT